MIGLPAVYALAGAVFAGFAILSLAARRVVNGAFWALVALSFLAGDRLGDAGNGVLALTLVALATRGLRRPSAGEVPAEARAREAGRHGNRLFVPALVVPAVTVGGSLLARAVPLPIDPRQVTLVALAAGVVAGLALAGLWLRPRPAAPLREGLRLLDSIGWAVLLPQMLTALGTAFAAAGVGATIGRTLGAVLPPGSLAAAVLAYTGGMALLTIALGNAFAAFPAMAAAIGVPVLIRGHGGDPAAVAALGMLAGFCGTLLTPLAANYNLVPAALLELRDRHGVIRAQAPTAVVMWLLIAAFLYVAAFPHA